MPRPTTLSKSRFKLALECPTKVFYSLDARYVDTRDDDEFLAALADGGFQVGALAKAMYEAEDPGAVEVTVRDQDAQVAGTRTLLAQGNATIFEGTVRHGNLLVRVDVLRKRGNSIQLIEVKSKSFKPGKDAFRGDKGGIRSAWRPYLQDVAFQAWVFRRAFPALDVTPCLLLVDSTVTCDIPALGTAIRVDRNDDRRPQVTVDPSLNVRVQRSPLLRLHEVSEYVEEILGGFIEVPSGAYPFDDFVHDVAASVAAGERATPVLSAACKRCEFYCPPGEIREERRSGFAECVEACFAGDGSVPREQTIFALYNHRRADDLLAQRKLRLIDLDEEDVGDHESPAEIALPHRHRLQIQEQRDGDRSTLLRDQPLRGAFDSWTFPLHFIDFETARPTLPFVAGRRPNQQLLFQYSHHVLHADGRLEHRSQFLETAPGVVPNAPVVRALRDALSHDHGTVLHWWDHERTVLRDVRDQLRSACDESDAETLCAFIDSLVEAPTGSTSRLVDMGRPLVARTAFIAGTDGRSSIKKVLQAVMRQSSLLRARYGRPVYGTTVMPSLNFPSTGWTWWQANPDGTVVDPYLLLGQLLPDPDLDAAARLAEEDEASDFVANGGAAMVAYGQLQRPDLDGRERRRLEEQLLRYCELDTLAMVMVYQALNEWAEPPPRGLTAACRNGGSTALG